MMKVFVSLAILCFFCTVSCRNAEDSSDNLEESNSELAHEHTENKEHNVKKYEKSNQHHHYHKKSKKFDIPETKNKKYHSHQELKELKHVPKVAPVDVPVEEAELQADVRVNKKHVENAREDLHLQDLTYEQNRDQDIFSEKSPHHFQRSHHKKSHVSNHKASKVHKDAGKGEEKLFADHVQKENTKISHQPILEDSFETMEEQHFRKEKKAPKKSVKKQKKAFKEDKKQKKDKKGKKDKKYKNQSLE